jgi:hypothetical protein
VLKSQGNLPHIFGRRTSGATVICGTPDILLFKVCATDDPRRSLAELVCGQDPGGDQPPDCGLAHVKDIGGFVQRHLASFCTLT